MVTSEETLRKIRKIIENKYSKLLITIGGKDLFSKEEISNMKKDGIDISNVDSLLRLIYNHNFINAPAQKNAPTSIEEMKDQQSNQRVVPQGEAHEAAINHINNNMRDLVDKLKNDVRARINLLISQNNEAYRRNALQNLERSDNLDDLVKESTLGRLKAQLRDTSGDANRDWKRVAITETSNTIGMASVDRIVADNKEKDHPKSRAFRQPG